jgi:alpha-N-arabinofuranosidase
LRSITDHILTGGNVDADTDPVALYHAFMGYPTVLEQRYRELEARMRAAGNPSPRMAITELQLFAHFRGEVKPEGRFRPEFLPSPDTIAEALSLALIVNACIRLGDFVELLTHSATVNHGGGLRKQREQVYANPVHYAHALGAALAGGTPMDVVLTCETFATQQAFGHIPPHTDVPVLDAMAVVNESGELVLWLVHRGADCSPIDVAVTLTDFQAHARAEVVTMAGETWYARNTLDDPEHVTPRSSQVVLLDGKHLTLRLPPFSLTRALLKPA